MAIPRTSLLDLPLPVTGSLSGDWGAATNNGLTEYLDIAVAGSLVLNTDADVTLTSTDGDENGTNIGSTTAQYAILRWTATGSTTRNITVPAKSKTYIVINATGGTQSIVLRGAGPTTGVTIVSGEKAVCAWNGSDFVKVGGAAGGSNTQVQYNNNGVFGGSADLTWDGSTLATTGLTASGAVTLSATSQNIALGTSQVGGTWTAGGASQTGAITLDQSTKTHTLNIGTGATENALTKTINLGTAGVSGSTTAINIGSAVSGATTNVTLNGTVQPGVVISGSSSGDALRITQTGAGNALLVEDSANPDSSPFVVTAAGDVGIGTTSPAQALHVVSTGNQIKYPLRLQNDGTSGTTLGVGLQYYVYNGTSVANLGAIIGTGSTWSYGTYSANQMSISSSGSGGVRVATASAPITFHTGNADSDLSTERMRLDSSGNLGLGVTPSAWSVFKAAQVNYGALASTASNNTVVTSNAYYDGTYWKYIGSYYATTYNQNEGTHFWRTAPSGFGYGTAATSLTSTQNGNSYTIVSAGTTDFTLIGAANNNVGTTFTKSGGTGTGTGTVSQNITFTQAMTLDASGNLVVGATSANSKLDVYGTIRSSRTENSGYYSEFKTNYSDVTSLQITVQGSTVFQAGATNDLNIYALGANNLKLYTDSTERARITSGGYFKASNSGAYVNSTGSYHEFYNTNASAYGLSTYASSASFTSDVQIMFTGTTAGTGFNFCTMQSAGGGDTEFKFRGDGNGYADGTWNNNGADYAEYFESANGQALTLGASVVLDNNKVREATSQDLPSAIIGVVRPKEPSKASMVVGNTAWNKWANKYLTDDFDRYVMEDHDVVEWEEHILERESIAGVEAVIDEEGNEISPAVPAQEAVYRTKQHSYESHNIPAGVTVPSDAIRKTHDDKGNKFQHYKLNPAWDKNVEYINRENRPEWNIIGLVGQVKVLKGQPVNDRWIKMRDVSANVEEWFIR